MTLITSIFCALVALAAVQDLFQLKISNAFPVILVALFGAWVWQTGFETDVWENAVMFAIVLAIGTLLFSKGWFGGGDVKLLATIALWFDLSGGLSLVMWTTLGGGLLSLLFIFLRRVVSVPASAAGRFPALRKKGPIPYGIAIAAGAILCAQTTGFNPGNRHKQTAKSLQTAPILPSKPAS
jgi:prepilin peptidase CpaA